MEKQQLSEECSGFASFFSPFPFLPLKVKGIRANLVTMYTRVLTQINQIINKFVALGVGIPDKGRLRVAMR